MPNESFRDTLNISSPSPLENGEQEALRLVTLAQREGLILRVAGGIAIKIRCKSAGRRELVRHYADIDMVGLARQREQLISYVPKMGYVPKQMSKEGRLIYYDLGHSRQLDIFLDTININPLRLNFKDRLGLHPYTLTPADLLISKLQVIETSMAERVTKDILAILIDFPIEDGNEESINGGYIAELCRKDSRMSKTFMINLEKTRALLPSCLDEYGNDFVTVADRLQSLMQLISQSQKRS